MNLDLWVSLHLEDLFGLLWLLLLLLCWLGYTIFARKRAKSVFCISSVLHLLCVVAEQDEEQVESNEAEAELHKVAVK